MRRINSIVIILLILTSMPMFSFNIHLVESSGTIYIRADGSIDPPTANIITLDNIIYTFTGNIYDSIIVLRDNIIVDGSGYILQGGEWDPGIDLGANNVTIKNTEIKSCWCGIGFWNSSNNSIFRNKIANNNYAGILLEYSVNNSIFGNNITNNEYGISLVNSVNNSIFGNNITNNEYGIDLLYSSSNMFRNNTVSNNTCNYDVYGWALSDYLQDMDDSNKANGKPVYYWVNRRDMAVPLDAGYVALVNCTRITVQNLTLTNNGQSILLAFTTNSTITNNNITANNHGISLVGAANNNISRNKITNNHDGIWLLFAFNNTFRDNEASNNTYNYGVYGWALSDYLQDMDDSNKANGKPVYYWVNRRDMAVPLDAGYVALVNCTRITVQNLTLTNNGQSILLAFTTNSTITNNNITANMWGIDLSLSSSNSVSGNKITNNDDGIIIYISSNHNIFGNNITNNWIGIQLDESSNNNIYENIIKANTLHGIFIMDSYNDRIFGNIIELNDVPVCLYSSQNTKFYHNNFISNTEQVHMLYPEYCVNDWDDGCEGNYWSGYIGTDSDGDGIGDTPIIIAQNNTDRYPLMNRYWNPCDINHDLRVDMKDIGTSARAFYSELGDPDYNCHADITGPVPLERDGIVNMRDIGLIARHFGETYS